MRKISIFTLFVVAAFCLNCGTKTETNLTVNKTNTTTAPTNMTTQMNKPAPTNTNAPTNTSGAASNEELDFTLVNKTGYDIKTVSVGATGTGDWAASDELLKGRAFKNGDALEIKFDPKAKAEKWDIKVEWADGSGSEEWLKLNLTEIEKVTLVYDKEKDETSALIE